MPAAAHCAAPFWRQTDRRRPRADESSNGKDYFLKREISFTCRASDGKEIYQRYQCFRDAGR